MDKKDIEQRKIMQDYRDKVMLKQVFSLKCGKDNILETDQATKFLLSENPTNLGQRYRNCNVIKRESHYFLIIDDTTEVKYQ